jgi:hypothetical protein
MGYAVFLVIGDPNTAIGYRILGSGLLLTDNSSPSISEKQKVGNECGYHVDRYHAVKNIPLQKINRENLAFSYLLEL